MADAAALLGVTATLRALLNDRMEPLPGTSTLPLVTVSTPQGDDATPTPQDARANLFLFRVTENAALKNQDVAAGPAYGEPPLSLDLHYLLTAYGASQDGNFVDESAAHFVLGSAMRVLFEHPVITASLTTQRAPGGRPILHPGLRGEREQVRLGICPLSLDDLTKVWTALTLPLRLSAAYLVTVVQVASRRPLRHPKPVGEPPDAGPRIAVIPFRALRIDRLAVHRQGTPAGTESPFAYARIGDTLLVRGADLGGSATRVLLAERTLVPSSVAADRLAVTVPDDPALQPGALPVAVAAATGGTSPTLFRSNRAVAVLVPRIDGHTAVEAARTLTVDGSRLAGGDGTTLVGPVAIPVGRYTTATDAQIAMRLPDTLPAAGVTGLLSGPAPDLPAIPPVPDLNVTIGAEGPHTVTLARQPGTVREAAALLEEALRASQVASEPFAGARATAAGDRLAIVPGGLRAAVTIAPGPTADALRLSPTFARQLTGSALSGALDPFPSLTAAQPSVRVTVAGAGAHTAAMPTPPTTLADAAAALQAGIRGGGSAPFADARVAELGRQLLVVPGGAGAVTFAPVAGVDETTAAELGLRARFDLRVRVGGFESLEADPMELPA